MDAHRRKAFVAAISVASNALLVVLKLAVGLATGAVSVFSEAIHSGLDLVAAVIALLAVRASARAADERHPFGHGKFENISGAVEALLIFVAAAWIVSEAVHKLRHPAPLAAVGWGVAVMLVSAVLNTFVARLLFRCGRETQSVALLADGWHLLTDVYTSAGVMLALAVVAAGRLFWPGLPLDWIDPVAAMLVALLILKAAWNLTRQSVRDLLDVSLPPEERRWIEQTIAGFAPEVRGFHNLRTRRAGMVRYVELHLQVAPGMSVLDSHALAHRVTDRIKAHFGGAEVIAHVEPARTERER
jgi:cation diffusion facilitator family transporter